MKDLDSTGDIPEPIAPSLILALLRKGSVLASMKNLLERGDIQDPSDRIALQGAIAFIENPSGNLRDIMSQVTSIGEVLVGYSMQGESGPSEVNALNAYFWMLQGINRIAFVELQVERIFVYSLEMREAMSNALRCATILAKGYGDEAMMIALSELQNRLDHL
jgi:hypothetical protein